MFGPAINRGGGYEVGRAREAGEAEGNAAAAASEPQGGGKVKGDHIGTGNRCGHDPKNWKVFVPPPLEPGQKPRPLLCSRAAQAWYDYIRGHKNFIPQQRGETCAQRSERAETVAVLGAAMLYDMDILTMRVGKEHDDGSFSGISLGAYATQIIFSLSRVERAASKMASAAVVKVHEICEKVAEDVYRGLAAIRVIPKEVYEIIGKDRWLAFEQRRQSKKAKTDGRRAKQALARIRLVQKTTAKPKTPREEVLERELAARAETKQRLAEYLGPEKLAEIEAKRDRERAERRKLLDLPDQPLYGDNPEVPDTS